MQFINDEDPLDVATGVVTSIVRHKKSKKLTFKYWNHHVLDQEPTDPSNFEYIDLNYAVSNCKWSKYRPTATVFATVLLAEECYRNRGLTRNSVKRTKQQKRKQEKLGQPLHANTALLDPQFEYTDFHALTALDLNADGTRLTSATSLKGPDKELWERAHGEEIVRLIESKTGRFIHRH